MIYYSPITDYVKKSTFPDTGDIAALEAATIDFIKASTFPNAAAVTALNGSSIDFIKKSTHIIEVCYSPCAYLTLTPYNRGFLLNGSSDKVYVTFCTKLTNYTLANVWMYYRPGIKPCSVALQVYAGNIGDSIAIGAWSSDPFTLNQDEAVDQITRIDLLPSVSAMSAKDYVNLTAEYTSSGYTTDMYFQYIKCVFTRS